MINVLALATVLYVATAGVLFVFQRKFIYAPDRTRPEPVDAGVPDMAQVVLTTEDGLELVAWWRPPAAPRAPVMVYFHGNAGHIGDRGVKVRPYLDAGWGVLLCSWRGYSGNPGRPSERGLYSDGRAALSFVAEQGIASRRVVLYGESLGSGVAVHLAAEADIGAVALEAPFSSVVDVAARKFKFFPARLMVRDRFESIGKVDSIRGPLLLVHGESDDVVPVALGRKLFEAASEPKQASFIAGAAHSDLHEYGAPDLVLSFVDLHLRD